MVPAARSRPWSRTPGCSSTTSSSSTSPGSTTSSTPSVASTSACRRRSSNPRAGSTCAAGTSTVTGDQALAFVRVRAIGTGSDIDRIDRQQAFLSSLITKARSSSTLLNPVKLVRFLEAATKSLTTDPELANLNRMRQLAQEVRGIPAEGHHLRDDPMGGESGRSQHRRVEPEEDQRVVVGDRRRRALPPEPPDPTVIDGKPLDSRRQVLCLCGCSTARASMASPPPRRPSSPPRATRSSASATPRARTSSLRWSVTTRWRRRGSDGRCGNPRLDTCSACGARHDRRGRGRRRLARRRPRRRQEAKRSTGIRQANDNICDVPG